ncbi:DUF3307 domain-containing protein [Salinimonas sediminis]|uniref:DUF3307 domain-containing protein n=1 Tax=Salinimonas sediminis TaxID=2303538 RepID=A0A346NM04_9ALTE|nr:DUF3307 domain-containing protein [Salinimonas sediminis]AXR06561.1 DUF3307 domain-containing protein [Salinimonas sediminis]
MSLLLLLLAAHFIGDFYLQPTRWIANRNAYGARSRALYMHTAVHGVLAILALYTAGLPWPAIAIWSAVIALSHGVIDWLKAGHTSTQAFVLDQLAHLLIITIVTVIVTPVALDTLLASASKLRQPHVLIYIVGYLVVLQPASIFIGQLLAGHAAKLQNMDSQSLGTAGRWIGYVERLLALSFVLVDQYTGLGFLVATKTVFRVGDLSKTKDMRLTEYMMLGTLISFAIALIIGWALLAFPR